MPDPSSAKSSRNVSVENLFHEEIYREYFIGNIKANRVMISHRLICTSNEKEDEKTTEILTVV